MLGDEKVAGKISGPDRSVLEEKVADALAWLEKRSDAEASEFQARQKELEGVAMPIMTKLYSAGGGDAPDMGGPGGPPSGGAHAQAPGPHIEEVD